MVQGVPKNNIGLLSPKKSPNANHLYDFHHIPINMFYLKNYLESLRAEKLKLLNFKTIQK